VASATGVPPHSADAGTGPRRRTDEMQVLHRCLPSRKATGRSEQEILADVMAAADLVATDEIGVFALQV
jgi:hypothetical protein